MNISKFGKLIKNQCFNQIRYSLGEEINHNSHNHGFDELKFVNLWISLAVVI